MSVAYRFVLFVLAVSCVTVPAKAQITRGPFLQNVTGDQATICWSMRKATTAKVIVRDEQLKTIASVDTDKPDRQYEARVTGLKPGSRYTYEVVNAAGASLGQGSLQTAPPRGKPITFALWGDTRKGGKTATALGKIITDQGAGMFIHTGDMVNDGKLLREWDKHFFGPLGTMMRSVAVWPVMGNHDVGAMPDNPEKSWFAELFALPDAETYYSFDYGDAHFLVLDVTRHTPEQLAFAEKDLASTDAPWRFLVCHNPPYSSSHHPSDIKVRTIYGQLAAKYNVDMLFVGHNHNYMLTKPIRHVYEKAQKRPYIQLVSGGGGAYPADFHKSDPWFDYANKTYHIVMITIDGDRLESRAIAGNGKVFHRFVLDKSKPIEGAVSFERIELERYFRNLSISKTNIKSWPSGLLLPAGTTKESLVYNVSNPLPEPIEVEFRFDCSKGLAFDKERIKVKIEPKQHVTVEAPFMVTSVNDLYPLQGPEITFVSPVGTHTVRATAPPVGLAQVVNAKRVNDAVTIDGKSDEQSWITAESANHFVPWQEAGLVYQTPASSVKAFHDSENLYLCLQRPAEPKPNEAESMSDTDHFSIFLATPKIALGFRCDVKGRSQFEGTKGLGEQVKAACHRDNDFVTWELKIPLESYRETLPDNQTFFFNIMEKRGRDFFVLSPTFRQHPSRETSGMLRLDQKR